MLFIFWELLSESVSFSMCEMRCGLHRGVVKMNEQVCISSSDPDPALGKQVGSYPFYTSNSFLLSSSRYPKFPRTQKRTGKRKELSMMALNMHKALATA